MARRAVPALLALMLIAALPAAAQQRVGVRVGDHAGHGRIVFDWPAETTYRVEEQEGRVVLRFARPGAIDLATVRRPPRNTRSLAEEDGAVVLTLAPGARLRHFRLGNRVVVDVLDPPAGAAAAAPPRAVQQAAAPPPAPRRAPPAPQAAVPALPPVAAPPLAPPPVPAAPPSAAPVPAPVATVPLQASPPAPRLPAVRAVAGGFAIPAPADVGAALLRRGGTWLVVFDAALPLDPGPLAQGAFAGTEVARGPQATVLRIPAAALAEPRLTRRADAWLLENAEAPPGLRSIRPELEPGPPPRLLLRATRPANAVAVLDPETGGTLLVGTLLDGGEAVPVGRRAATFEIVPTRLGAAILPHADTATLRALPAGFAAGAGPGAALALGPEPTVDAQAAGMTRLFDLPAEPLPSLIQRERNATLAVAAAPPLGRGPPRLRNAEALLALGLGAEAQAMTALAMREDPRLAEDPAAHAVRGAAALLAGRLAEADGLLHRHLPDSDELALWRGLLAAARGAEGAAPAIAAGLPILRAWPQPLQARLAPLAAEALAAGGEAAAAQRLLAGREDDPAFALARAFLLEAAGDNAPALEAYEAVMRGRDRRARAVAMRRAVELRLASGALDAAGAAVAMEGVLAAWRGDALESGVRLRLAALRREAGDHRGAFELLRETEQVFPDLAAQLRPQQVDALLAAIGAEAPIAAVSLFDAHAALLPPGAPTEQALAALADGLAALDLPVRAQAVLRQALRRAEDETARGRLGLRMADLALGAGDPAGARAALADTGSDELPDRLRQARALSEARALARMEAFEDAAARYRDAGPDAAPEHAEMLAGRQDWAGAAMVLGAHLAAVLPPAPAPLPDDARRLVARTAALLALAGDEAGLAALRDAEATRMAGGPYAEAFALITAGRMGGIGDLPRIRQEVELARALPSRLDALRTGAGVAR
jgi:hypothetical protein